MLKFLSKVKLGFNALNTRSATSNPACQIAVNLRTYSQPPQITITFINNIEESFNAASTSAQSTRSSILEKGWFVASSMLRVEGGDWNATKSLGENVFKTY